MENTIIQGTETTQTLEKRPRGILIAGRVLLIVTLLYTAWWLYHLDIETLYLSLYFNITVIVAYCVVSMGSIMTIVSSIAIIRKQKRGFSILAKSALVDLVFPALIISITGIHAHFRVSLIIPFYFATKIFVLIYLWRNKRELL